MYQLRLRVQNQFMQMAKRRMTKLGLGLTPACQNLVDKMISVGVSRLEHQRALEREEQLIMSEANLNRCLSEMQNRALALGTYPIVDDEAFNQMYKKLSPMWPFC